MMTPGPGVPLTYLQFCDDAVLIVLVLDGRGHDGRCGGRASHLGHSPAQLHLGLLYLQLLRLGLLQAPGLRQDQAPAHLLGSLGSRPSPTCPSSSATSSLPSQMASSHSGSPSQSSALVRPRLSFHCL